MYQPSTSGSDSSRRVSAVGAQSTTMTSHRPLSAWSARSARAKTSSSPGTTASSSASIPSTPAQARTSSSHDRIVAPRPLQAHPGVELLTPEALADLRSGCVTEGQVEGIGQAVGRVGGDDQRALAARRAPHRGGGGDGGLADTALAGEQQDPHRGVSRRHWGAAKPSTRAFSSESAVLMIRPSARRFTKPGIGMMRSTASS